MDSVGMLGLLQWYNLDSRHAMQLFPHLLKVAPIPIIWGKDVALGT